MTSMHTLAAAETRAQVTVRMKPVRQPLLRMMRLNELAVDGRYRGDFPIEGGDPERQPDRGERFPARGSPDNAMKRPA